MIDAYFLRLTGDDSAGRYRASEATIGPWSPRLQHGGPPNALAVALAERVLRAETGRDDLVALRLAADFVGPVPVGEFDARVTLIRAARSAALAEVVLTAGERECLRVRVWFVRIADTSEIAHPVGPRPPALPDEPTTGSTWGFGYGTSVDWRFVDGGPDVRGPAVVWARGTLPLLGDAVPMPGLAKVALVGDSASGVSSELDWAQWSYVNVDLDVHLSRPFHGDWVLMDAMTTLGPAGSALARCAFSDERGTVGSGLQTLVLAPLPNQVNPA